MRAALPEEHFNPLNPPGFVNPYKKNNTGLILLGVGLAALTIIGILMVVLS